MNYLFAGRCSYRAEIVQEISRIEIARQADRGSQRPLRQGKRLQLENTRRRRINDELFFYNHNLKREE